MKRYLLARLAALLWPYLRPFVQDLMKPDPAVQKAEQVARHYLGE